MTKEQIDALQRYLSFDVTLDDVLLALSGIFTLELDSPTRTSKGKFKVPEPGVLVTKDHISNALECKQLGLISERDLVCWATMILHNDAYEFDAKDQELIADWLNDISFNLAIG